MEIKRNRYLNTLISKKHNGLIKVITGMRRCGKSYLLFTLFKEHLLSDGIDEDHIIEIAFLPVALIMALFASKNRPTVKKGPLLQIAIQ